MEWGILGKCSASFVVLYMVSFGNLVHPFFPRGRAGNSISTGASTTNYCSTLKNSRKTLVIRAVFHVSSFMSAKVLPMCAHSKVHILRYFTGEAKRMVL